MQNMIHQDEQQQVVQKVKMNLIIIVNEPYIIKIGILMMIYLLYGKKKHLNQLKVYDIKNDR
jgi:hypothetical protein